MKHAARPWAVSFTVEGLNGERFLRSAARQGIRLTGVRRTGPRQLHALVQEDDLPALEALAMQGGWSLTRGRRRGIGRAADWVRARWLLCAVLVCAGLALAVASQAVWSIEVLNAGPYTADIREALEEWDITVPLLRQQLDLGQLREALAWRYPRIAWFECGWRGTKLVIRVVEGVLPRTDRADGTEGDVVALRDSIVHTMVVSAGTPVVEPGDIVREGEVLIRGEERTHEGEVRPVAARGSVIGRVWEGASVRMPVMETLTTYTGNEQTVWTLRTPWFDLWKMPDAPFAQHDTAVRETPLCSFLLPVTLHQETRMEAECVIQPREMTQLREEAYEAAVRKLHEKLLPGESLIDIWGNCSMIDSENVLSLAVGEMLVEIGISRSQTGMAAPGEESSRDNAE